MALPVICGRYNILDISDVSSALMFMQHVVILKHFVVIPKFSSNSWNRTMDFYNMRLLR